MNKTRVQAMHEMGWTRSERLAREVKTDTINYGVLPLMYRDSVCSHVDSAYYDTDDENQVDIYLYNGKYVAVDSYDREIY